MVYDPPLPRSREPSPSPSFRTSSSEDPDTETLLEKQPVAVKPPSYTLRLYNALAHHFKSRSVPSVLFSIFCAILPSFISHHFNAKGDTATASRPTFSTQKIAALDGLRGVACLIVVNQHFTFNFTEAIFRGYGLTDGDRWVPQLPIVNLLWSGHAMVNVFFVMSGIVLSAKPLRLARLRQWDKLHVTLGSSAFRRIFRLYLPMVTSTLCIGLAAHVGVFDAAREVKDHMGILTGNEGVPIRFATLAEHIRQWWGYLIAQLRDPHVSNDMDLHLWTIPIELWSSMSLFVLILALSRLRSKWRLAFSLFVIWVTVWWNLEWVFLFFVGMLEADLDQVLGAPRGNDSQGNLDRVISGKVKRWWQIRKLVYIVTLLLGMFFASMPYNSPEATPGFRWLMSWGPPTWGNRPFWKDLGAAMIVWVVLRYEDIHFFFTNRFVQYLGKISFALYIMHGPVIRSLGYTVIPHFYNLCGGRETVPGFTGGWFLTALVVLPVIFWAADVFWRLVDRPSVEFGKWLESKIAAAASS